MVDRQSGRMSDYQLSYDKHLSVRTLHISKLTSNSSPSSAQTVAWGYCPRTIRTSSSKSRSPTCNPPLRIRSSAGQLLSRATEQAPSAATESAVATMLPIGLATANGGGGVLRWEICQVAEVSGPGKESGTEGDESGVLTAPNTSFQSNRRTTRGCDRESLTASCKY
jgi:hypothetical protein